MPSDTEEAARLNYTWKAGNYFDVMGIELLRGRDFTLEEQMTHLGRAIVSQAVAQRLWPGLDSIGRQLRRQDQPQTPWLTVVGVVDDVRQNDFRNAPQATVYLPLIAGVIASPAYVVKSSRAETLATDVTALLRSVAPRAPLYGANTVADLASTSMAHLSFTMVMLVGAAGLAFLLGITGLYGVLSYLVSQRVREIGIRMALGAGAARIGTMIVARGGLIAVLGLCVGVGVALVTARVLDSLLFEVQAVDVTTYVGASAALLAAALLASYLPASRASRVDPNESLRRE